MAKKVILVHGFMGDFKSTWGRFPELLNNDPDIDCEASSYGYSTCYLPLFGKSASIHNLAEGLFSDIDARCNLENDELILVGHSLGGLVIRKLLLNLHTKGLKHNISKICFFAVPHDGSGLANLAKLISWRGGKVKALCKDNSYIEELNDLWSYAKLSNEFEVLSVIGGKDAIVNANSAKSIFREQQVKTNIDAGHINIVKPKDENDLSFLLLKQFIESKRSVDKYSNAASENYRDWLAHDSGRSHGYSFVADENRKNALKSLQESLKKKNSLVRITGLSGLGKTRLITEYIDIEDSVIEENIIIFNASSHENEIKIKVKKAIRDKACGLIVIEHCSIDLHDYLAAEIANYQSNLRIITVDFYNEKVDNSPYIHLSELDDISVTELIKPVLPQFDEGQLRRIVSFVEGFPLLAILIAERFRDEGILSAELTERDFAKKLINADGKLSDEHKRLLQACSLFDVFGIEDSAIEQADYIIKLAKSDRISFGEVIHQFTDRKIINRVGRFARVVPKPLAVHLASMWWENNIHDELEDLINTLPDSLLHSFCTQIKYLDTSPKVREFVSKFCGIDSPFGKAELLLTTKGSNLFRALVEVNQEATNTLIYRTFLSLSDEQIKDIGGDVRRNLVWSLEMLVFHASYFEQASWCLFKLAQFENENYSNNATGQFSQLFRWQLSGTQANFEQRLFILNKILLLNVESADLVVIKAINVAIDTHGGSRTIGAEFQGTKPKMQEWCPELWQEIYDYWQSLLNIFSKLVKKTHLVDAVKDAFGHQIRGFMRNVPLNIIDSFIREVVASSGKYWPAASQSITHIFQYDLKGVQDEQLTALQEWEALLAPDANNLEEKLKLIVLNPFREHEKGEDGHYIDMAAEEAKALAHEIKDNQLELVAYFELLMTFSEQKQTWVFAKEIVLSTNLCGELLEALLSYLRRNHKSNTRFISGFLFGLNEKHPDKWVEVIDLFGEDEQLQCFYPDVICTGYFNQRHLNKFIELIQAKTVPSCSASMLNYGRATEHLTEVQIAEFCASLRQLDAASAWIALDTINMYTHGRNDYDYKVLKPVLIDLVLSVSFKKEDKSRHSGSYHWSKAVEKLLKTEAEDFSISLCEYLISQVADNDVDYSDLWDYLHEAFYKAFELHGEHIWPLVENKFIQNNGIKKYRLVELLGSGKERLKQSNSIFTLLDEGVVINWCKDQEALLLVARTLSMFDIVDDKKIVNSLLVKLIENYGDDDSFLSEIRANFHSRGWAGSLVPYLERDKERLVPLKDHENHRVRNWATDFCRMIDLEIDTETKRDAEESMLRNFHS